MKWHRTDESIVPFINELGYCLSIKRIMDVEVSNRGR